MKRILFLLSINICGVLFANAQSISPSIINSNGGFATIGGNTYEWSIGEMVLVHTASAGSIVITQGLLQPGKPNSGAGFGESQFIFDHVNIYPNPTDNIFYLSADFQEQGQINTILYDMNGKIISIQSQELNGSKRDFPFNISNLASGNYMLIVTFTPEYQKNNVSKAAYKIEKTN
jgi:hypothetical protein